MKKILFPLFIVLLLQACEEKADSYKIKIGVVDGESWTLENTDLTPVPGAAVMLYKGKNTDDDLPDFNGVTDQNGEVVFNVLISGEYLVIIEKGNMSNVIIHAEKDNLTVGYVIEGVFANQAEVDSYVQPSAEPGDLRIKDLNADGLISVDDMAPGTMINITEDEEFEFAIADINTLPEIRH